ncbi:MAG: DNA gyrase C-terminal beta-propeller domain-containing protein, partial [Clostridia bacterium]
YYQVVKLKENDEVVNCEITEGSGSVVFVSSLGMTLNMNKTEIPVQGRISSGVIGISLEEKDEAICACQCMASESIVVLTDKGFAKRVALSEFEILPRNRKGLRIVNLADNGK